MPDLDTCYLGLGLRTPLVASSSPLTADLDGLRQLEDAGAAACVLPSLFEEQILSESRERDHLPEADASACEERFDYFPDLQDYNAGPDCYLDLIRSARRALDIPVIASLNGTSAGDWIEYARLIEQAGASALELNLYLVAADADTTSEAVEAGLCELVSAVREEVRLPLAVKISPYFSALAHIARRLVEAGSDGLVLFNRFVQPDVDLETLEVTPRLSLSTPEDMRLCLRWIGILRAQLKVSLAATSGVRRAEDVVKLLLAGADVAMLATALLERGPRLLCQIERDLVEWLDFRGYASIEDLKSSIRRRSVADMEAFERGNYMRALKVFANSFRS